MKWFRVLVRGEHVKMDVASERRYMGFFVTRFANAATPDRARASVIAAVRAALGLDGLILNDDDDPPLFFVDEAESLSVGVLGQERVRLLGRNFFDVYSGAISGFR